MEELSAFLLQQIRPHGGIFVDHLSDEGQDTGISLGYTMVVDDQVLATFTEPGSPTHTQVNEVHHRWVMVLECRSWFSASCRDVQWLLYVSIEMCIHHFSAFTYASVSSP